MLIAERGTERGPQFTDQRNVRHRKSANRPGDAHERGDERHAGEKNKSAHDAHSKFARNLTVSALRDVLMRGFPQCRVNERLKHAAEMIRTLQNTSPGNPTQAILLVNLTPHPDRKAA